MRRLSLLLALAISLSAQASKWEEVRNMKRSFQLDSESIVRQGGTTRLWTRVVFLAPETVRFSDGGSAVVRVMQAFWEMDCAGRRSRLIIVRYLPTVDSPMAVREISDFGRLLDPVAPDTMDEAVLTAGCALR